MSKVKKMFKKPNAKHHLKLSDFFLFAGKLLIK